MLGPYFLNEIQPSLRVTLTNISLIWNQRDWNPGSQDYKAAILPTEPSLLDNNLNIFIELFSEKKLLLTTLTSILCNLIAELCYGFITPVISG